jgi:peptidoglycan/LPS O-acetylase OafA/YrhL
MKPTYRPEIDGLRAVAVGAVILYHAQITITDFQPFKGGFIGVDIFFVISGYLITSIILKELVTTGSFSFKHFYERRIRRILPVLLFVILISLPFAWMYLIPSSFVDFSKSILYSLGFSSNFYFHYSGQVYGALAGPFVPFLHTWSLSVEEQYYILFPIVLLIIFKYFRKYLIHILILGFFISLGLADWTSRNYPSTSFYFIHTRMWELLAGSILAYFEITNGHRSKNKLFRLILPTIGLLLIGHSILFFKDNMFHPSFYTLSPVLGVCLIIWFSNKSEFVTKILSTKLFVGIGLISYSLYLWHYPIFAFLKINGLISGSLIGRLILIPALFFLSILSYLFVERYFRNKKVSFSIVIRFLIIILIAVIIFNLKVINEDGFKVRFENLKEINENYNPDNIYLGKTRMNNSINNLSDFDKKDFNIIIMGDSHGGDLFNALYLNRNLFDGIKFYFIERPLHQWFYKGVLPLPEEDNYLKQANAIILSYRWDEYHLNLLKDNFEQINKLNEKISITSKKNEYTVFSKLYPLLDYEILFKNKNIDYFGLKKLFFENRVISSNSIINQKVKNFALKKSLIYLNNEDYMCNVVKKECDYVDDNGHKIFYDYGHYTEYGARYFGKKIYETNWLKIN